MLINDQTQKMITSFVRNSKSSVIVSGDDHSGVHEIVQDLGAQLLGEQAKNNVYVVGPTKSTIGVDQIRELKQSLTTIVASEGIGRVAVVRDAELMTKEAQNALLKLIEEPPVGSLIILQTSDSGSLLETIRSRCQVIRVLPISEDQAVLYAQSRGFNRTEAKKAYKLSDGASKLFQSIVSGESSEMVDMIEAAKTYLGQSVFERLQQQKVYADQEAFSNLLRGLEKISVAAMRAADTQKVALWRNIVATTRECRELLAGKTPIKLVYLMLCTSV